MFESNIKANEFIEELKEEIDVALPIPDSYYISWLNSAEQLLYSEIIKKQREFNVAPAIDGLSYQGFSDKGLVRDDNDVIRFTDIYTIYVLDSIFSKTVQLIKGTLATKDIFEDVYYDGNGGIALSLSQESVSLNPIITLKIIYFARPKPKTINNVSEQTIKLPIEFIDMIRAKVRGEAYKFANEDGLAAKWLNEYNVSVENFKVWIKNREANFGM